MKKLMKNINTVLTTPALRNKIIITLALLALYRLLVVVPVPFVDIAALANNADIAVDGLWFFAMLLGWSLENFSLIAVWLAPFINASIIIQLMTAVVPKFEELQEMGEQWTKQLQQYTRYFTFPLAIVQGIGMVYFINSLFQWGWVIDTSSFAVVLLTAFSLSVGAMLLLWIGDLITEKWITNGVSLLIFASVISGITQQTTFSISSATNIPWIIIFMLVIVLGLILLSLYLLKSMKEIPIVYARQGKIQETSSLPIPLNPVGMIPIIFAIAFTTFPYLIAQLIIKTWTANQSIATIADWIDINLNIYSQNPSWLAILIYFLLIITFTFFYTLITFNPDRISDSIQKRGWFIPGVRPWEETARYINKTLMHLCLRWWIGLGLVWIYSYLLYKIPQIQAIAVQLGSIPVVVQWSWVIIIVWVVQELINKVQTEILMTKYGKS